MKTCAECILCLLTRDLAAVPAATGLERKALYQREVLRMIAESDPQLCTAQLSARIDDIYRSYFGKRKTRDFASIKSTYNAHMLALEALLRDRIAAAPDPLAYAIRLAQVGNYIDFGAKHEVDNRLLEELITDAEHATLDENEYAHLLADLNSAKSVVYISDNAGEIVLDKLLIERLLTRYPEATFTLLVRSAPTLNDATLEDAQTVGLTDLLPVIGNGNAFAGTIWSELSAEARALLTNADVLISKGQANFETLSGCGRNIYYLLLCKCDYFVRRFQVPRLTGLFVNEHRLPPLDN